MRVISGILKGRNIEGYNIEGTRGRNIEGYNIEGTRPTMDRVKESVFGSIQDYIKDSIVLDLFAGSGNLGIEAISNGCKYCYFVDNNIKCINTIPSILNMDYNKAIKYFNSNNIRFNIIFIDPPYDYHNINRCINNIIKYDILDNNGILVLEFRDDKLDINTDIFNLRKVKRYGDKFIYILQKTID